jgi:cell division protease FtsH
MNLPERDRYSLRKSEIEAKLAMMFGGRVAEELIFGAENVTTGASNDIQQATDLARRMVTEWGMSDKLGRLRYSENEEQMFLGRAIARTQHVSDDTARLIDHEVRRIVEEAEHKARDVLTTHMDSLHALANGLLMVETLDSDEVQAILRGEDVVQPRKPDAGNAVDPDIPARMKPKVSGIPAAGKPPLQPQTG